MKNKIINLRSKFYNLFRELGPGKITAILILPGVLYGLYSVLDHKNSKGVGVYAVDPLLITYNGDSPPDPMFEVTGMLPGDEAEKIFNVKNDSAEAESVVMDSVKKAETNSFASILDVEISEVSSAFLIFSGKLANFFSSPPINLGAFAPGEDKNFRVKVKFPATAGNEYQEARVEFDIIWITQGPPIELPAECSHLSGIITSVIEGTENDDNIRGTSASELILAKGGSDRVRAGRGHDCIVGGDGDDKKLDGSDGNDVIIGGAGNDNIDGSDDDDILYGNDGDDFIDGGGGNDIIYAGSGNDDVEGGSGNDEIYGDTGNDEIDGGSGSDTVYGGDGNDDLRGGSGSDDIFGENGNDSLRGNSGNDLLDGGGDNDNLNGNSGIDTCVNGEIQNSCEL